jgi:GNAT superfamily N-acetyltransferase
LLQWDRPLSEQPESVRKALLNPGPSKSLGDVGAGNSDNASYLLESSAAAAKSGGGGNVPLDAVMSNRMGGMLDNGKVANPVVGLVPVDVVDVLTSGKLSPNGALDSNAMNLDLTPSNGGNSVPFGVNAAGSPVGGITRPSFAENAGVGGDVIGVPKNTLAALRAGDLDKRSGHEIYRAIADELGSDKAASDYLTNGNVLGIRYLDGMSRDGGKGTYNYVMFDDKGIKLLERNGSPIEDFAARRAGKAKPYREATGQRTLQDVVSELEQRGITVDAAQSGNNPDLVTLSRIVVPQEQRGQGVGTQAMQDLIGYADEQGKTIALSPSADFGASSVDRLKDFYKRFGFVDNKGKGRDFEISESMYRRGGK